MTCHRRENVHIAKSFKVIWEFVAKSDLPVFFPASYRTQQVIEEEKITLPKQVIMVDPIGYEELLILLTHAKAVFTDSGTLTEEASVLQIPCVNIRKSSERIAEDIIKRLRTDTVRGHLPIARSFIEDGIEI